MGPIMLTLKKIVTVTAPAIAFAPVIANADVVISNDPTQNINCANGICTPTAKRVVLNAADLSAMLEAGDTTILSQYLNSKGHVRHAGPIDINAALSWTNSSKLTLSAYVYVNAPIVIMGTGALTVSNTLTLQSSSHIDFWDPHSGLSIGGTSFTLVGDISTLAADIASAQGKGTYALANDYDAAGDGFRKAPIPQFSGQFTGLGHSIANLKISAGSKDCEGLVAENYGTLRDIGLKAATVTSTTQKYVGGLAGCNFGLISNASVDGTINASSSATAGGIAGANLGDSMQLVHVTASVSGGQAGGVVGENDGNVVEAYASGSVIGQSNVGGLVGANKGGVVESYSTAAVNGNGGTVGGLAGFNNAQIQDSYSTGAVTGTGVAGGMVGYDPNESVVNGYWDLDTSGIGDPNQGAGFPKDDTSITGLTSVQLQARLPSGFDRKIWHLDPSINNGFPYLLAIPPQ
jgi:hypothetical protein